ncbi:MAG TPA: peptidoglycan DD-metalloendopeptidase family protein [Firmicutes bacterium]|nr:peptidoglycan DD-metalloendopeptidase family protein [Bacillota bacterium]
MKKRKRCFTVMIIPHSEEATYSLRFPLRAGQLVVVAMIIGLSMLMVMFCSYRHILEEAQEAQNLREESRRQHDKMNVCALETQQLLAQIEQVEHLTEKVADRIGAPAVNESISEPNPRFYASRSGRGVLDRAAGNINLLQQMIPEQADSLGHLNDQVEEYTRRLAATPSIWPTWGRITSGFGNRRSPFNRYATHFHQGVDIAASYGTPICATADGTVSTAAYLSGWGNLIIITHGYGYQTYYAHLSGFTVSSGERVTRGQVIGYMGRTGRSTGVHLHYEVHVNGVAVNPLSYMR